MRVNNHQETPSAIIARESGPYRWKMMMEPSELVQFSVECTALGAAAEEALAGAETARRAAHAACLARDAALESEREILRGVELVAADLGSGDAADGADEMKLKSFVSSALLDVMEEAARVSAAAEAAADKFNADGAGCVGVLCDGAAVVLKAAEAEDTKAVLSALFGCADGDFDAAVARVARPARRLALSSIENMQGLSLASPQKQTPAGGEVGDEDGVPAACATKRLLSAMAVRGVAAVDGDLDLTAEGVVAKMAHLGAAVDVCDVSVREAAAAAAAAEERVDLCEAAIRQSADAEAAATAAWVSAKACTKDEDAVRESFIAWCTGELDFFRVVAGGGDCGGGSLVVPLVEEPVVNAVIDQAMDDSDVYSEDGGLVLGASIGFTPFEAFWAVMKTARPAKIVAIRASEALSALRRIGHTVPDEVELADLIRVTLEKASESVAEAVSSAITESILADEEYEYDPDMTLSPNDFYDIGAFSDGQVSPSKKPKLD